MVHQLGPACSIFIMLCPASDDKRYNGVMNDAFEDHMASSNLNWENCVVKNVLLVRFY